jgi:hypothetical protein
LHVWTGTAAYELNITNPSKSITSGNDKCIVRFRIAVHTNAQFSEGDVKALDPFSFPFCIAAVGDQIWEKILVFGPTFTWKFTKVSRKHRFIEIPGGSVESKRNRMVGAGVILRRHCKSHDNKQPTNIFSGLTVTCCRIFGEDCLPLRHKKKSAATEQESIHDG